MLSLPKPTQQQIKPTEKPERDLKYVYAHLSKQPNYETFRSWCDLAVTSATDAERKVLSELLQHPEVAWINFASSDTFRTAMIQNPLGIAKQLRWFRIHHPTDPSQWIGIGILDEYSTGRSDIPLIAYRIPVGFRY